MTKEIAVAVTVAEAALLSVGEDQTRTRGRRPGGAATLAAIGRAIHLSVGDLTEVLVFVRVMIHNYMVSLRAQAQSRDPDFVVSRRELEGIGVVANALDALSEVLDRLDSAVATREKELVPAFVPACLQHQLDAVETHALAFLERGVDARAAGPARVKTTTFQFGRRAAAPALRSGAQYLSSGPRKQADRAKQGLCAAGPARLHVVHGEPAFRQRDKSGTVMRKM